MRRFSFHDALRARRLFALLTIGALAVLAALACPSATAWAETAASSTDLSIRPEFREPVSLMSKDGVLEVRLTARQGQATLDTVAAPVQNFLLFDYEVIRGTASDGRRSGGNRYPAPTLRVFPGERLVVHFENSLSDLTIRDYFVPQYRPKVSPFRSTPSR
jgi:FtsP/CotA-like multicopper oxidase with cupredoxin domain